MYLKKVVLFISIVTCAFYVITETAPGLTIRTEPDKINQERFINIKRILLENPKQFVNPLASDIKILRTFDKVFQRRKLIEKQEPDKHCISQILAQYIWELDAYYKWLAEEKDKEKGISSFEHCQSDKNNMKITTNGNVLKINIKHEQLEQCRNHVVNSKSHIKAEYLNYRYRNGFGGSYQDMIQKLRNYESLLTKNSPISSTDECTRCCILSRWYAPNIRKT